MTREEIYNLPKCAGIYCIKNTINGKCYIGQAIKLQKQIKAHWNSWQKPIYANIALYEAFKKYGIENFEIRILQVFHDSLGYRTKRQLDILEKRYIEEYDSYNNGYNSTLEGEIRLTGNSTIKAKNLETNLVIIAESIKNLSEQIGVSEYTVKRCIDGKQILANKIWIFAHYNNDFPNIPEFGTLEFDEFKSEQFKALSTKEEIQEYIRENPNCSYGEIAQNYQLSKKIFYDYKKELQ